MSFFKTLFKTIKTTANVTGAGLEQLNKGLDGINKGIGEAVEFQEVMKDAYTAYRITDKLVNAADELSASDLKFSKYPPETIERLNELMPGRSSRSFASERKINWPAMRRPKAPDALLQAKADDRYQEYLVTLEQTYARIRKKCERSAEYEKFLKQRLIRMGCPFCVFSQLWPDSDFDYFSLLRQNNSETFD